MDDDTNSIAGIQPATSRNRVWLAALAVVLVVAVGVGGYWVWLDSRPTTPQEALATLAEKAVAGDSLAVAAAIDTTAIVNAAVDDLLASTQGSRSARIDEYLKKHPDISADQLKAKTLKSAQEELQEHIRSGTLPKRINLGSASVKALVAKAIARGSIRDVTIDGDIAHVTATVPYGKKTLTVKVRMRRSGETWVVDKIENMADVLRQAGY